MRDEAGDRLGERSLPEGTVTLLLADIEGSVRLWESTPADAGRDVTSYKDLIARTVDEFRGVLPLEQGEGDAFVAAFPRASDALRCALDIQIRLEERNAPTRPRMALHTGEVEIADGVTYMGQTINRCARIRDAAHGGQLVVSRATYDVVADGVPSDVTFVDLGPHRLRDLARAEQIYQINHPKLPSHFPPLRSNEVRQTNLPHAATSFVGREAEIEEVRELLGEVRLLTLTGPGGCGKTRLALEVASRAIDGFADGVWLADLAPLSDPAHVLERVARAVGVRADVAGAITTDALVRYLEAKDTLIVFDNCEHLVGTVAVIASTLLEGCRSVRLLATSREPLGVGGESSWRIPPLDTGSAGGDPAHSDGLALFAERARQVRPNFVVDESNVDVIADICRRLDGLPLAIELAAARLRALSPRAIADALADRFRLLSGGARTAVRRQQTLRASLDWSYDLLDGSEAAVLRRMAVFASGFSLDAAEDVCTGGDVDRYEVLDILQRLVDRSLVMVLDDGGRYRLLESIQEYAAEKLAASDEAENVRDRHRDHYLAVTERFAPELYGGSDEGILAILRTERENIRSALRWTDERRDDEILLRLVGALAAYWDFAGPYREALHWLDLALERASDSSRAALGRAHFGAAMISMNLGNPVATRAHAEQALSIARESGDDVLEGRALVQLGIALLFGADPDAAHSRLEEALEVAERSGDEFTKVFGLQNLGNVVGMQGDYVRATAVHQEALERSAQMGNLVWRDINATFVAYDYFFVGRLHDALEMLESVYHRSELNRFVRGIERSIGASIHLYLGNYELARSTAEQSLVLARTELGGEMFESFALFTLANVKLAVDGPEAVGDLMDRAVSLVHDTGMALANLSALTSATEVALARGDLDAARGYADRASAIGSRPGARWFSARATLNSARVDAATGDVQAAFASASEALAAQARMPDLIGVTWSLELIASLHAATNTFDAAVRLWGASHTLCKETGLVMFPSSRPAFEADVSRAKDALGAEAFDKAWAEGASMTLDEAVTYATKRRSLRKRPASGWGSLSPIERQVVDLVAEGLTNPQIGERLFISKRTVQAHLARIFRKVDVSSRAQLAAEAVKEKV